MISDIIEEQKQVQSFISISSYIVVIEAGSDCHDQH